MPALWLVLALYCARVGFPPPAAACAISTFTQQPQDPQPAPPETKPVEPPQQPLAQPVAPEKPPAKSKKVITNDDLNPPVGGSLGFTTANLAQINDCNRTCFEQIRQLAHIIPSMTPNWKHDLLKAIDQVRKDYEWQQYLRDLYEVHLKFCQLGDEKREELAKYADPANVTPRELAIDEKYDVKFSEAQSSVRTLYYRQADLQKTFLGYPLAYQFSNFQASRIQSANCYRQPYPNYSPSDAGDP